MKKTKKLAFSGIMTALCVVILFLGSFFSTIDLSLSAISGMLIVLAVIELGDKHAWGIFIAASILGFLIIPTKYTVFFFAAFLGWYPVAKWPLEAKLPGWRSLPVKLLLWNACAGAMAAMIFFVFRMDQVIAEYREMSRAMLIVFAVLANVTLILYDRLLNTMALVYVKKLRPKLFKG
jgi:Na+/H+ antiporter NhaD/arsenite permease-like protein